MPLERSRSAGNSSLRMDNLASQGNSGEGVGNETRQRAGNSSGMVHANGHMTLDGRRRPRNNQPEQQPVNTGDRWDDWTSTWRRIGDKGRSKPVTMTGTITRGKRRGETVDVQLDLTRRELLEISHSEETAVAPSISTPGSTTSSGLQVLPESSCTCAVDKGPHVLMLSILAFPFIFIASILVSFYFGALTWQNIFTHFYDERTIWHRISICPILVLTFPLFIVIFTLGIAVYAAFVQLRWSFTSWRNEVSSLEKGFYGWLCGAIGLEDCSPYTVIELFGGTDLDQQSSREDGRVAVSYAEQNASNSGRAGRSLPTASGHSQMSRVESTI